MSSSFADAIDKTAAQHITGWQSRPGCRKMRLENGISILRRMHARAIVKNKSGDARYFSRIGGGMKAYMRGSVRWP